MKTEFEAVCVEGLKGKKYAVRKNSYGWFGYKSWLWLIVDDGVPCGYSEYFHNAWLGTKKQAEKLIKIESSP